MLSVDEAIEHAREVAKEQRKDNENCKYKSEYGCKGCADYYSKPCIECAKEHEQLAEWLEELKDHRERECNHINETLYDKGYSDGYNKAIEYFVMLFKSKTSIENRLVDEIAEQLKEGVKNE